MPCIQTKLSCGLPKEKEAALKRRFGKVISLLPGKSENWLMLTFEPDTSIWFQGTRDGDAAFVEVKLFGGATRQAYERMTAELTQILQEELELSPDRVYIRYEETEHWGWNGGNF